MPPPGGCRVQHLGDDAMQPGGLARIGVCAYIWSCEVLEYYASHNATQGLYLMASLFKSYGTVEHSLNSAGKHRMGNKLSTKKLQNGIKHWAQKKRFTTFFREEVWSMSPKGVWNMSFHQIQNWSFSGFFRREKVTFSLWFVLENKNAFQ